MFQKVSMFFGNAALHLTAALFLWIFLIAVAFIVLKWCAQNSLTFKSIVSWITGAMVVVVTSIIMLTILPDSIANQIVKVVVPNVICALALHALLLSTDCFMKNKYNQSIASPRLFIAIILIYFFMVVHSIVLLKLNNVWVIDLFVIVTHYLIRVSIVWLLLLQILNGRCNQLESAVLPEQQDDSKPEEQNHDTL